MHLEAEHPALKDPPGGDFICLVCFSFFFSLTFPSLSISLSLALGNKRRLTAVWRVGPWLLLLLLCRLRGCCSIIFKTRRDKKDVRRSIRLQREDESGDIDLWPPAASLPHLSCCPCSRRHGFPARGLLPPLLCGRPHVLVSNRRHQQQPLNTAAPQRDPLQQERCEASQTRHSGGRPLPGKHLSPLVFDQILGVIVGLHFCPS